ncbi:uncharacterized protein TM35_000044160 [Trypanosoma theileri]|uniref:BTB domain-containing protein n=1 Tax=Trypanosoma theileri TaxID=67003 RepID=A0A1X0P5J3_9TRYP|nr:uncharacterized protein TM35_000044160 [Trypanosoma theileri]ORC92202.1 hypothetical protein TM35_000044160 [Trypanosoma theileri]
MPQRSIVTRERQKRPRHVAGDETKGVESTTHSADIHSDENDYHSDVRSSQAYGSPSFVSSAAAEIQHELKKQFDVCQLVERDVTSLLKQRDQSTASMDVISSFQNISPNEMVRLNVGDTIFTVPLTLLLSKDGNENYFDVLFGFRKLNIGNNDSNNNENNDNLTNNYLLQPPILDETGALFIDRDPATFHLILNYLRGYRLLSTLNEDQLSMLKTDARYFQLHGLMKQLGDQNTENTMKFRPGPGVNPERNRFRVIYGVAVVGHRFLITGRHRITFQVMNSDYVGIGLVSESCVSTDQEFHKTSHCCVYYMTGVFYSNFPHHRKEDGLEAFEKNDYVSLMVDMNKRVAEYTLKNSTKIISLGNARKLRFAVAMKLSSSVRIVPEEEAAQLPLFQRKAQIEGQIPVNRTSSFADDREALTQLSQPSGAGTLASGVGGAQEQASSSQQLQQQQQQQQQQVMTSLFMPRSLEGGLRPALIDGLGRATRPFVLSSFSSALLPGDISAIDPILLVSSTRERRDDA